MKKKIELLDAEGYFNRNSWDFMTLPLGDGSNFVYQEPLAQEQVFENGIEVIVEKYSKKGLPNMQQTDTSKHFYMSNQIIEIPQSGKISISVEMAAKTLGASGQNYQEAFAIFNLLDDSSGYVYDSITTGNRFGTIYERVLIPGLVQPEDAFTYFAEAPYITAPKPLEWHNHTIEFDLDNKSVTWFVDEKKFYFVPKLDIIPKTLRCGFGLFSFVPYENGNSVSIKGQGLHGRWKNFEVEQF